MMTTFVLVLDKLVRVSVNDSPLMLVPVGVLFACCLRCHVDLNRCGQLNRPVRRPACRSILGSSRPPIFGRAGRSANPLGGEPML